MNAIDKRCRNRQGGRMCLHAEEDHSFQQEDGPALCDKCGCLGYIAPSGVKPVAEQPLSDFTTFADFENAIAEEATRQVDPNLGSKLESLACSCGGWVHARGIKGCEYEPRPSEVDSNPEWVHGPARLIEKEEFESGKVVERWADPAMFKAEPIDAEKGPKIYLLSMTPDPLGTVAAAAKMYKGEVVRDLSEVTDDERRSYLEDISKSRFKAPFEFVQFHILFEGVTRAFTHQLVRSRHMTFTQESMRFAVKEDLPVGLPPSLAGVKSLVQWEMEALEALSTEHFTLDSDEDEAIDYWIDGQMLRATREERQRVRWDRAMAQVQAAYGYLVNDGLPTEDARGLLPTNTLTRVHMRTDLNSLLALAGNRLCTQAQFEWRIVFSRLAQAIRQHGANQTYRVRDGVTASDVVNEKLGVQGTSVFAAHTAWQADAIADMFRPICYMTGKCEFKASFDRSCSIRDRVDANAEIGRGSEYWNEENNLGIRPINDAEWLADPGAAR